MLPERIVTQSETGKLSIVESVSASIEELHAEIAKYALFQRKIKGLIVLGGVSIPLFQVSEGSQLFPNIRDEDPQTIGANALLQRLHPSARPFDALHNEVAGVVVYAEQGPRDGSGVNHRLTIATPALLSAEIGETINERGMSADRSYFLLPNGHGYALSRVYVTEAGISVVNQTRPQHPDLTLGAWNSDVADVAGRTRDDGAFILPSVMTSGVIAFSNTH